MLTQTTNRVPQQIFTWALRQETWLHRRLQRAALRAAQAQAFARFAEEQPQWAESLFDEHFLCHAAARWWPARSDPANRPTASEFLRYLDAALEPYQASLR